MPATLPAAVGAAATGVFAVLRFPGTNCERETVRAIRAITGEEAEIVRHDDGSSLSRFACVVVPGGFSYGDHLRAGAIARFAPVMTSLQSFADAGGLVLGICNGFQILVEAGLLPGAMLHNATLRFWSDWAWCRVERADTPFTSGCAVNQVIRLPVAHGEGNYTPGDQLALRDLEERGGVVMRYVNAEGETEAASNPNGSVAGIAGVRNARGNIFGLMPHPERACEAMLGGTDGRLIFESLRRSLSGSPVGKRQEVVRAG